MKKKAGTKNGNGNGGELTYEQLKELFAQVAQAQAEAAQAQAQVTQAQAQVALAQAETNKQIDRVDKQLGDLGNKWGRFTEGLAFPSMTRLLDEQFGMPKAQIRVRSKLNGSTLELGVLGYNDEAACVVEIKSHLREDGVKQILDTLSKFPKFFPEHGDKRLYGMIAAVDFPEAIKDRVKKAGLYLARVQDETFEFEELFPLVRAKDFNPATKGQRQNGHR
ncbi:MAG: DUF3782 domain-containing protein [Acidobacteriota bacterium]|nr:DUF3782 domain-containing protein [Acidobacteriota bacterium]